MGDAAGAMVDLRSVAPGRREGVLMEHFAGLDAGESFTLVSGDDPRALRARLAAEHADRFNWDVLQQGSPIWRVRVEKLA